MKKVIALIFICYTFNFVTFADTGFFFYVQFADKNNTPFSLEEPLEYLSPRAIERRMFFGIAIDSTDLPVNPEYVSNVKNAGVKIVGKSRWLNGVTILAQDSNIMQNIRNLPFVTKTQYTGHRTSQQYVSKISKTIRTTNDSLKYGSSEPQIKQIKADALHNLGYRAKGIQMAVIDGGFFNANINPAFDSLRFHNRLLGTKDFTDSNISVYDSHQHGANVLSIMAGNLPNQYIGIAPEASFWLLQSEYNASEYLVETDFWISAIEFADSAGVDMATSSLGYRTFEDPSMNFTYNDMNGQVSRASIVAEMAAHKGLVVCVSAGNDGSGVWHYIASPADARGIVTVGSVTKDGNPSPFSSYGPSADGRVKPELVAMGSNTAYVSTSGTPTAGNGTSYSTPVMAGALACFLQYAKENFTNFSVEQLLSAVFESGNTYLSPQPQTGYGIPNFELAMSNLNNMIDDIPKTSYKKRVFYNSESQTLHIDKDMTDNENITLYSVLGKAIFNKKNTTENISLKQYNLSPNVYILRIGNTAQKLIVY